MSTYTQNEQLAARFQAGDKDAGSQLVTANQGLIARFARRYGGTADFDDLMQEGAIGLLRAAELFDASLGYRFSTFAAFWVRCRVSRAARNALRHRRGRVHEDATRLLERLAVVYDAPTLELHERDQQLAAAVESLPARDAEVVQRRYGIANRPAQRLEAIARSMGLRGKQTVHAVLRRSERRLRGMLPADYAMLAG